MISLLKFSIPMLIIPILLSLEPANSSITIDKQALLSFKSSLNSDATNDNETDPLSNWAQESPLSPCNWTGVQCDPTAQRVTGLDLSGRGLSGPINPQIANLSFLRSLNLPNNRFSGPIPPEIASLSSLRTLNLSANAIDGELPPNLRRMKDLRVLDLTENRISGKIPDGLGELARMEVLGLGRNRLGGEIPRSLGNLSSLVKLNLGTNELGGGIPSELGGLRNLKELDLTINNLTGTVPDSIYNLTSLVNVALASNNLSGEIPQNIGETLPNLVIFNFCINRFTGKLPASLHNLPGITQIRIAHNFLHGTVPPGLENLPNLEMYNIGYNDLVSSGDDGLAFLTSLTSSSKLKFLAIDGNRFEGPMPESIGDLSPVLVKIYMGGNRIYGVIPPSVGRLTSLTLLDLTGNLITGQIPTQIGDLKELQELGLAENRLSGSIPSSLGGLRKLNILDLSGNSLVDYVPSSFGNLQSLLSMDLSDNNLTGTIPKECLNLASLSTVLNLSNNFLTGPLPEEIGRLKRIFAVDLSNNQLTGPIPSSIGECQSLERLFMRNNELVGEIPKALANVKGLEVLDLSSNQLSGYIPVDLQNLHALKLLNLSFNNFEGPIPENGVFRNMSSVHLDHNQRLCSNHFTCLSQRNNKSKRVIIVVAVCSLVAILATTLAICLFLNLRKQKSKIAADSEAQAPFRRGQHQIISYKELRRATGDFASENLVGRGSFGLVYKGRLSDGTTVAVKVLDAQVTASSKSFVAECEALRSVRHRNLVGLVTSCSSIDGKRSAFLALVYEFLSCGSLEDWLTGRKKKQNGAGLSFVERLNIVVDVACALDYLHHDCTVPVVHCDIKPSNILLDEDLVARVGDFGLARLLMEKREAHASISSTHTLKGSVGYIPPEYGLGQKPWTAGDAYSFGVMVLELFTGMSPAHESFSAELNLPKWVHLSFPENLSRVIDPELAEFSGIINRLSHEGQSSSKAEYDCLVKVVEVGLCCSRESADERIVEGDSGTALQSRKYCK